MERLKHMKEMLVGCVEGELTHLERTDSKELGEAIDMIKDLSEAIYYCTITEAMEGKDKNETRYYTMPIDYRDMDRDRGRKYYSGSDSSNGASSRNGGSTRSYTDFEMRDMREGRSGMTRKGYMEAKEMHHAKEIKMKELEKYLKELSEDVVEMVEGASPEEKQLLKQKMSTLISKIDG
jgi:hypothetical protein